MYNVRRNKPTTMVRNTATEGETIEVKMRRVLNNKEPITDGAPLVYTARKDGVLPQYDIRTDRFEIAVEAMDKVAESHVARRTMKVVRVEDGNTESIPANPGTTTTASGTEG